MVTNPISVCFSSSKIIAKATVMVMNDDERWPWYQGQSRISFSLCQELEMDMAWNADGQSKIVDRHRIGISSADEDVIGWCALCSMKSMRWHITRESRPHSTIYSRSSTDPFLKSATFLTFYTQIDT